MPRDLFGDVSDPSVRVGSRKWYTVPLSLFVHTVVLLLVVVIPLVATGALPDPRRIPEVFTIIEPELPEMPPVRRAPETVRPPSDPNAAPTHIPDAITPEPPDLPGGFEKDGPDIGFVPGGRPLDDTPDTIAPPPPPPKKSQEPGSTGRIDPAARTRGLRGPGLLRHRPRGPDRRRRDYRSDDRCRRSCDERSDPAIGAVTGRVGARGCAAVDVSADDAERRSGARDHDRHGEFHAAEMRPPCAHRAISTSRR